MNMHLQMNKISHGWAYFNLWNIDIRSLKTVMYCECKEQIDWYIYKTKWYKSSKSTLTMVKLWICNYYDMVSYFVKWRYLFRNCNKRFHNNNKNGFKKNIWTLSVFLSKMFKWKNIKWGMLCQRDFLNTLMYLKIESEMKLLRWGND